MVTAAYTCHGCDSEGQRAVCMCVQPLLVADGRCVVNGSISNPLTGHFHGAAAIPRLFSELATPPLGFAVAAISSSCARTAASASPCSSQHTQHLPRTLGGSWLPERLICHTLQVFSQPRVCAHQLTKLRAERIAQVSGGIKRRDLTWAHLLEASGRLGTQGVFYKFQWGRTASGK